MVGHFRQVFGFGRQKDIEKMSQAVQLLEKQFKAKTLAEQTVFKDMHSALDLTSKRLGHISSRIDDLTDYTKNFVSLMYRRTSDVVWFTSHRYRDIFLLSAELSKMTVQIRKLQNGLATIMQGHISPELISFDLAKTVLDQIATHLAQTRPQETIAITLAQEFYEIQDFYIQRHNNTLYLGVHIPISYVGGRLTLYKIDSYPLPVDSTSSHMTYVSNPKHFLAQSMDKRYYFHPTTADLMAYCTPGHHKVCSYQPPLHDAGQDLSCEYAVFTNSRHITKDTCKYSISSNPIEPKIVPLNSTTYLVLNVTEYTINCKGMTDTRSGCVTCLLVLTQSCECIITYHSTTLFPQYSQCDSTTTSTEVKYPRNLMVAKLLLPDKDLHHLQGDTLGDSPADIALPPLKIFDDKIAKGVPLDKKDDLDL